MTREQLDEAMRLIWDAIEAEGEEFAAVSKAVDEVLALARRGLEADERSRERDEARQLAGAMDRLHAKGEKDNEALRRACELAREYRRKDVVIYKGDKPLPDWLTLQPEREALDAALAAVGLPVEE